MTAAACRRIGPWTVPAVGYGAMVLSPGMYEGAGDEAGLKTLGHVIERGMLIDTSDVYGRDFHNERLIGEALRRHRQHGRAVVATKFGQRIPPGATPHPVVFAGGKRPVMVNAEPQYVRQYAVASLTRLGVERIDLWYPHFPDPEVPIAETVGAMADVVAAGLVAHIGLSNVTAAQLREAASVHPISAVQTEWSLWHPIDGDLRAAADEAGAAIVAWWPLGAGALTGPASELAPTDLRASFDQFSAERAGERARLHTAIAGCADRIGATPAQVALAWLLHQHDSVVPIPGTRQPGRVDENLAAAAITLPDEEQAALTHAARPRE